jgi:RNA polymerase sigma-70 factor (ECF subfamily)
VPTAALSNLRSRAQTRASTIGEPGVHSARSIAGVSQAADLRALYDAHIAFVWRNLRRLGVAEAQLDDAAQEVFLVVHRRWDSFDASWSSPRTWLFGILLRVAQNERRAHKRRSARFAPDPAPELIDQLPSTADSAPELLAKREAALLLERMLEQLPDAERTIFVLVDVEQMSVPEAAEALRLNLNTAYSRIRSARKSFERALVRLHQRSGGSHG